MTRSAIRPWNPTARQEEDFRSTDASFEWLCHLPTELVRQYAGRWVAVKECRVLAAADSLDQLLRELGDTNLETVIIDRIERPAWVVYR